MSFFTMRWVGGWVGGLEERKLGLNIFRRVFLQIRREKEAARTQLGAEEARREDTSRWGTRTRIRQVQLDSICCRRAVAHHHESLYLSVLFHSIARRFSFSRRRLSLKLPISRELCRRTTAGTIPAFVSSGLAIATATATATAGTITVVRVRRQSHRLDELIERPGQKVANLQKRHADHAGARKRGGGWQCRFERCIR